jgi:hypothetical protein
MSNNQPGYVFHFCIILSIFFLAGLIIYSSNINSSKKDFSNEALIEIVEASTRFGYICSMNDRLEKECVDIMSKSISKNIQKLKENQGK